MLLALQQSLVSAVSYQSLIQPLSHWLVKLFLIACSGAFFHHFYAGIRHLLQDVHWMTTLQKSRVTGHVVLVLDGFSVLLFAWSIFS
jgi:succinate dehydrogenase / fumarate reductase cytochrome b subunit